MNLYDCPHCCKLVRSLNTAEPTCRECGELLTAHSQPASRTTGVSTGGLSLTLTLTLLESDR